MLGKIDPVEYASAGNAILGIRNSGKTYCATYIAEQLFAAGIPFVYFDPIGVARFLRHAGVGPGIPVVVAGGKDGDLPLTVESAPEIVRAAMLDGVSLVIDLYDINLSKADWKRIVASCVRVLLHENGEHGLRHIFLEEAAEFAPQRVGPDQGVVYAEIEKLARMGGNARLGYTLINQRAEEVSKAVLELCDNLFLHRQKGKNSLNSLSKWLDVADVQESREIIKSLPGLPQGECWAWLAGTNKPERLKVPTKNSYHPDRRAMRGDIAPTARKAVDAAGFITRLQDTIRRLKQKSPEPPAKNVASAPKSIPDTVIQDAEKRGYERGNSDMARRCQAALADIQSKATGVMGDIARLLAEIEYPAAFAEVTDPKTNPVVSATPPSIPPSVASHRAAERRPARPPAPPRAGGDFPGAARKLFDAMNTDPPVQRTWAQFASLAGIRARGGHFNTGRKWLEESGLIRTSGNLVTVAKPQKGAREVKPDPASLVETWCVILGGAAPAILGAVFDAGGEATIQHITDITGLQPRGGHWNTGMKELRDNDIAVVHNGAVTLTELFRPSGRRTRSK